MDIVKILINCSECSSILNKPIVLPCGSLVCKRHLENLQNRKFFCKSCDQDHHIKEKNLNVVKALEGLINANLENLNFGPVYDSAVNMCNELSRTINDLKTIRNDPVLFIKDTIDKLKTQTELIREGYKSKIDQKADQIIEQLDLYEKKCLNNLNSVDFKKELTKLDENISKIKQSLAEWQTTLNDFGSNEYQWNIIKQTSDEFSSKLKKETWNFRQELLSHKLNDYFTLVGNFQEIQVKSDINFDNEFQEFNEILNNLDILSSKIIDKTKRQELLNLCHYSLHKKWKLIYRASEDGFLAKDFHFKCDDVPNTLTIIKSSGGYIFGGFTSQAWDKSNTYKNDSEAFLFSLCNPQNAPVKLNIQNSSEAIYCGAECGPTFGKDLFIASDSHESYLVNFSSLGNCYPKRYCFFKSYPHFTEEQYFIVSDIDIFQIINV